MQPLPAVAPDLGAWHKVSVHRDCHVAHDCVLYSVPFTLVGKTLWMRATDSTMFLYQDHQLVATRLKVQGKRSASNSFALQEFALSKKRLGL